MPRRARCAPTDVHSLTNFPKLSRPICVVNCTFLLQEQDRAAVEGTNLHAAGYSGSETTKLATAVSRPLTFG
jgi:hypothetical protein